IRVLRHEPLLEFDVVVDLAVNLRQVEPAAELLAALVEQAVKAENLALALDLRLLSRVDLGEEDAEAGVGRPDRRLPGHAHRRRFLTDDDRDLLVALVTHHALEPSLGVSAMADTRPRVFRLQPACCGELPRREDGRGPSLTRE